MWSLRWVVFLFCICFIRLSHQNESNITESGDSALLEEGPKCVQPISIGNGSQYDMLHVPSYLWPNGTIPYKVSRRFTKSQSRYIQEAISEIENASCVRFVKYKRSEHEDYVYIRLSHEKGCGGVQGRQGGQQNLWLSPICFNVRHGTVLHELLHTVGFLEENNRPDRDNYLDLVVNGTLNGTGYSNFIRRAYGNIYDSCDEYDYYSIMHFPLNVFYKNFYFQLKNVRNIEHPFLVGQRFKMSRLDKKKLNRMYNCWKKEEMSIDKVARKKQLETYELLMQLCEGTLNRDFIDLCQWKLAELKFCLPLIKNEPEHPKNESLT